MRHARPVLMAMVMAFCAVAVQAIELPRRVVACSCAGPADSLAVAVARDPVTVVVGTVGVAQPERTPLVVETWFHGAFPAEAIWLSGGTNMMSSCDVSISAGERRVMVLWGGPAARDANGLYSTSLCSPNATLGTAEGDALFAEAVELFGMPDAPPTPEPAPPAQIDLSPWLGSGLVYAAVLTVVALAMFGALALAVRRRAPR